MDEAERAAQYEICRDRGHVPSGRTLTCNPPLQVCAKCGTHFRFGSPQLIESNVPRRESVGRENQP